MFVYQPTLRTLQSQKEKGVDYFLSWKSKGFYSSIFFTQHNHFLLSIKRFGQTIGIQFEKDLFVVKQKKYATKIVTAYVVYDLDTWPKIPLKHFT